MPFTASIVERNFAYIPDRILKLGGAAWLRPLGGPALSTPWERIRIGVLCAVTPNGVNNIEDTLFLMGLCAGQANPGSAYATNSFIGASMIGTGVTGAARTMTYTAGAGNPYYTCTAGLGIRKSSAFSSTPATAAFSSGVLLPIVGFGSGANAAFYARRAIIIIDITKSPGASGNVTFAAYYSTTAATVQTIDMRPDHLFEALDQPSTPSVRGGTFTQVLNSTALTFSPLEGELDTFEIYWSSNTFPLEISAVGASIIRPLSYTGTSAAGISDETFEEYSVSTGSIAVSTFLTGGSGWSGTGSIFYDPNSNLGTAGNSSNLAAQVYVQYVGTTNCPDEPFDQYATGSIANGSVALNQGTFWTGTGSIFYSLDYNAGTLGWSGNLAAQVYVQYVGTTNCPDEPFDQYATGTVNSLVTVNQGTWWTANAFIDPSITNTLAQVYTELAGTGLGFPFDTFGSYSTNGTTSGTISTFIYGSYWSTTGTVYNGTFLYVGTAAANPYPLSGTQALAGTACGFAYDTFESYGTGAVVSGVTINAGSFWNSNGLVTTYSYP